MIRVGTKEQKNKRIPAEERSSLRDKAQEQKNLVSLFFCFLVSLFLCFLVSLFFGAPKALADDFNPNSLISDGAFINVNDMSENDIQAFLENKGSLLKDLSDGGRRAAKIIYDAAHGYGDASGSINGIDVHDTVSPKVILATIQKEEGLIEGYYADPAHYNQTRVDWAMGYGYTEGPIHEEYRGFTKQIENGAWQLRYNYERASGRGFADYQVGQNFCFDDNCGRFDNRSTASLYRYTPHVYNGNYNFWYYYDRWFVQLPYECAWVGQNGYPSLWPGGTYQFEMTFKNTGTETWRKGTVFLGTNGPQDRIGWLTREGGNPTGWFSGNRVWMVEDSVAPGDNATFRFWYKIPDWTSPGTYRESFRLVAENITWMNDAGTYWDVTVKSSGDAYHNQWISQNAYPTLTAGQGYNFVVNIKNTGDTVWYKGRVNLGTNNPQDRTPLFDRSDVQNPYGHPSHWISPNRIEMSQASVAPGETATFSFWLSATANTPPGTYREFFRLVAEGVTWMEDLGIYWDINVKSLPDTYHNQWISQNAYPTLIAGQGYNFIVNIRNTGEATWYKGLVNLGTNNPQDRTPLFDRSDVQNPYGHPSHWISPNRIEMSQASVAPGETATFSFWLSATANTPPGTYREFFRLVAEGVTWMEDQGIYWDVRVN